MSDSENEKKPLPSENIQRPTNELVQNSDPKPRIIPKPPERETKG